MSDRDRYLSKLSPDELLLWVSLGGELVTHEMQVRYRRAVASLGLTVAVTADDLAAVLSERAPRPAKKGERPMFYTPGRKHRGERKRWRSRVSIAA